MGRPRSPVPVGERFGHLVVVGAASPVGERNESVWACECDCGNGAEVRANLLKGGGTRSCGCIKTGRKPKHGGARDDDRHPLYSAWCSMRGRCRNPDNPAYRYYGGRGITVCERWDDFENYVADLGERPEGKTLDRIDVDGDYEPSNCRWATPKEQAANKRPKAVAE